MIPFAWNYTPDPSVTRLLQAPQLHYAYDRKVHEWYFPGNRTPLTIRQVAARLLVLPVITHGSVLHPHFYNGRPFCTDGLVDTTRMVQGAYAELKSVLSQEEIEGLSNVLDLESFNPYDKPPVDPAAPYAAKADHATTGCHIWTRMMRSVGFLGPLANYATSHRDEHKPVGGGNNRMTPAHVPGACSPEIVFYSAYSSGGPHGCLNDGEVISAINATEGDMWLCVEDYQINMRGVIGAFKARPRRGLLAFWGTDPTDLPAGVGNNHRGNAAWSKQRDIAHAAALAAAGWREY